MFRKGDKIVRFFCLLDYDNKGIVSSVLNYIVIIWFVFVVNVMYVLIGEL